MKKNALRKILVFSVSVFILFFCSGNAFARLVHNGTEGGFLDEGSENIRITIIEAAGHFLKSYSEILFLLHKVEISDLNGIDYKEVQRIVDNSIFNLENAREKYITLKQLADHTPYNQKTIDKLVSFNYNKFEKDHLLEGKKFNEVKSYLGEGDIRGIYRKTLNDIGSILDRLYLIQSSLYSFSLPRMSELWNLNQICAEFMLFGQHVARIFFKVTGKQA